MTGRTNPPKTVYIFGAGVSRSVGGPSQRELLEDMLQDERQNGLPWPELDFVRSVFLAGNEIPPTFPLEDVLTLLDRAIADGATVKGFDPERLRTLRRAFVARISQVVTRRLDRPMDPAVDEFARTLLSWRAREPSNRHFDPFAVLTFNWDIVFDHPLYSMSRNSGFETPVVDYCTYVYANNPREFSTSPHHGRAVGVPNVKILKLHGSLNWLACPNCNRLFVDFQQKIAEYAFFADGSPRNTCRFCTSRLDPVIIAPTMIKDFRLVHLRNVWHNAFIELSEATRVVFVGYSLPLADFDARILLSRAISRDAEIEVHLHTHPDVAAHRWARELSQSQTDDSKDAVYRRRPLFEKFAFEDFFGAGRCQFDYHDALVFLRQERRRIQDTL